MSLKRIMSIPELFRPKLCNTTMKFQVVNGEGLNAIGVAHVSIQIYGYTFKLPIFVCDLGDIDCIFELDAVNEAGFITSANEHGEPEQLSRSNSNAICHLHIYKISYIHQFY